MAVYEYTSLDLCNGTRTRIPKVYNRNSIVILLLKNQCFNTSHFKSLIVNKIINSIYINLHPTQVF